jgi:hypothetical protein
MINFDVEPYCHLQEHTLKDFITYKEDRLSRYRQVKDDRHKESDAFWYYHDAIATGEYEEEPFSFEIAQAIRKRERSELFISTGKDYA